MTLTSNQGPHSGTNAFKGSSHGNVVRRRFSLMWRRFNLEIRLVVMVALLAFLATRIDILQSLHSLGEANVGYLAASVCVVFLGWSVNTYKWRFLLEAGHLKCRMLDLFRLNLAAIFYGLALPGQATGEVIKAIRLGSRSDRRSTIYASVLADRISGLGSLAMLGLIGLLVGPTPIEYARGRQLDALILATAAVASLAALILPSLLTGTSQRSSASYATGLRTQLGRVIQKFADGWIRLRSDQLLVVLALGCVFQASNIGANWLLARGLRLDVSPLSMAWITALFSLIQLMPVSIGGIGVREATFVSLLGVYGIAGYQAVGLSLGAFGELILLGLVGFGLDTAMNRRSRRMSAVAADAESAGSAPTPGGRQNSER